MKKWFLKIVKAVDGTDMYVSEGFSLDEEQRCALCFDTKEEAEEYAMEMPDDDVMVVEEEIIQAAQLNQEYNNAIYREYALNCVFSILFCFYGIFYTCLFNL